MYIEDPNSVLKLSPLVNRKTYKPYYHVSIFYLIMLAILFIWTTLFMSVTIYPILKELIKPNPYSNNQLNSMSYDNFEEGNTIALRLASEISNKLELIKTLSKTADELIESNLESFSAAGKSIQDNKQT